jgi:hypothetical protein
MKAPVTRGTLPPATHAALRHVYDSRGASSRTLASSIGTTYPHVGRIMAGTSRPSVVLAERIGAALSLPDEFTALMMSQSSTLGRKMRVPDGFEGLALCGHSPCPVAACRSRDLMSDAFNAAGEFKQARAFEARYRVWAIGVVPAMGGPEVVQGGALDPWREFNDGFHSDPFVVWDAPDRPPHLATPSAAFEFIASIDPDAVVRCAHHVRS